MEYSTIKAN